jgi:hypothetical protein
MKYKDIEKYSDIKVKPGEIVLIPRDNRLLEMPPFANSTAPIAQWVREIHNGQGSIRRCAATMDYLTLGITIPAWTNFRFTKNSDEVSWDLACDQYEHSGLPQNYEPFTSQPFAFEQTGECPITRVRKTPNVGYPKLVNPFRVVTAPGWSTIILPCIYEPSPHYSVLPGLVNTDYYHEANCVLNLLGDESFTIPWGQPLMHLIPIERSALKQNLILGDEAAYKYVIGRGFGSGGLKPNTSGWSSGRLYRATRIKLDAHKGENKSKRWWRK